jgi:hypothetical protein
MAEKKALKMVDCLDFQRASMMALKKALRMVDYWASRWELTTVLTTAIGV